jgi:transposase InsO family protein
MGIESRRFLDFYKDIGCDEAQATCSESRCQLRSLRVCACDSHELNWGDIRARTRAASLKRHVAYQPLIAFRPISVIEPCRMSRSKRPLDTRGVERDRTRSRALSWTLRLADVDLVKFSPSP